MKRAEVERVPSSDVTAMVQFARPDYSTECALSPDELARLASEAVERTLEHAKMKPVRRRKRGQRVSQWTIRLAAGCVGDENVCLHDGALPGYFQIAERRIVIGRKYIENGGDVAFTVAHELGHWAWYALFDGGRGKTTAQYVAGERFANAFAAALIGRWAKDPGYGDPPAAREVTP